MNGSSQHEVDILGTQLAELDQEIDALVKKRAKIRCRFNRFRARTSVLPPETLSMIFQYACNLPDSSHFDDDHRPVVIGSVSTHWREVAHSTPSIWNKLCVNLKNPKYASLAAFSLIRLYFKNLGSQSITLRLLLDEDSDRDPEAADEEEDGEAAVGFPNIPIQVVFRFIIKEHPAKLRALFINEFSLEWSQLFIQSIDSTIGLPNLSRIHIGWSQRILHDHSWDDTEVLPLSTTLIPRLRDVSLASASPNFLIPHDQITDLNLEDIPIDYCLEVITHCPNASECHIFFPQPASDPDIAPPTTEVTLRRTTCLGWAFGIQKWDVAFLKYFTFPALERFRCEDQGPDGIEEDDDIQEEDQDIRVLQRRFLSRCPKLMVYERAAEQFLNWEFNDLCDDLPDTTEELYIRMVGDTEAEMCIQRLTRGEDSTMAVFPRLKVLELQGSFWYGLSNHTFDRFVEMLESRRRPLPEAYKEQFRIEEIGLRWDVDNDTTPPLQLTRNQKDRLQAFVNEGLKVVTSDMEGKDKLWSSIKPRKA